jgi:hypothetical protein
MMPCQDWTLPLEISLSVVSKSDSHKIPFPTCGTDSNRLVHLMKLIFKRSMIKFNLTWLLAKFAFWKIERSYTYFFFNSIYLFLKENIILWSCLYKNIQRLFRISWLCSVCNQCLSKRINNIHVHVADYIKY